MFLVKPPHILGKLYPKTTWRFSAKEKAIYLTFDDGPIPEVTPWVLDTLEEFNAKATFFCVGQNVEKYPHIYQQILLRGHAVGNHTFNHLNGWKTHTNVYLANIEKCNSMVSSSLFRPPYGRIKKSQLKLLAEQYNVIMWDVLSGDFSNKISQEKCFKNVIKHTKEGSVIVFHDSLKAEYNLRYALPKTLAFFKEKGFCFKSIT